MSFKSFYVSVFIWYFLTVFGLWIKTQVFQTKEGKRNIEMSFKSMNHFPNFLVNQDLLSIDTTNFVEEFQLNFL